MSTVFETETRFLERPVGGSPRLLLVLAALLLVPIYVFPLWNMTLFAPQYPDGLRLFIYSYKLDGAHQGQDVREVNVLNHYIGMHDLTTEDFTEFKWMPFVLGALGLLFLRAAVHGKIGDVLDVLVLAVYVGGYSLWSFGFKLWSYGHHLSPTAAVKVAPFMPPLFGHKQLANFDVYSYPSLATYSLALAAALLLLAAFFAWRGARPAGARS
ncbi:MAG TPA: hypothetical protein VGC93_14350 [Thermoanaerobaculia bacterium]